MYRHCKHVLTNPFIQSSRKIHSIIHRLLMQKNDSSENGLRIIVNDGCHQRFQIDYVNESFDQFSPIKMKSFLFARFIRLIMFVCSFGHNFRMIDWSHHR
jgi:hypothetical protein